MSSCRLCGSGLDDDAGFRIDPAPAGAQLFRERPDEGEGDAIALRIAGCSDCGLVQSLSPEVPYHRRVVSSASVSGPLASYRRGQARRFVDAHGLAGARVVEIGAGGGWVVDILAGAGLEASGTEWESPVTRTAAGRPIASAYPAPGSPIPGAPYRAFFCLNFLEHAPDPRAFLGGIRESLEPAGVGLLEVPNHALQRRLARVFDYVADHLSYFDADSLRTALALSGFLVDRVEETRDGESLEAWVRRRPEAPFAAEAARLESSRAIVRAFLDEHRRLGGRVAAWGASHMALTLLAATGGEGLTSILDSSPAKQGRFAPVTGLPIVAPTAEAVQGLAGVVILAPGFEREIASILRESLGFAGAVWTLRGDRIESFA